MSKKNIFIALLLLLPIVSFSDEFTSSSFKVLDPVINPAGYSSSNDFSLWGTMSEIGVGTSSALSYSLGGGFLRFPYASAPTVSATAGDAQVALSWTASDGAGGWTASGYSVGRATVSGGPYTYTSLGNVLSSTRTGLTNSTTYYFVIVARDSFDNFIATSTQVSATPTSSGGGGGGGGGGNAESGVRFSGRAYPLSKVSILKDGQLALTTIAGPDSNFSATLLNLSSGNYRFSVFSEDSKGMKSSPFVFPIVITEGVTTDIGGIFIAPTIGVDKKQVKRGDTIVIFGQSAPSADVIINVNSENEIFVTKKSDAQGVYLLNFDSSPLEIGSHSAKSKASLGGQFSYFSSTANFTVGASNLPVDLTKSCPGKGDLNSDCRVNLVDFSIAAFWYKKTLSDVFKITESAKLNNDGRIDLVDFSIMAYNWTG